MQLDEEQDREKLTDLRSALVDAKALANQVRTSGDEELKAMYRDASVRTQDMLVLENFAMDVINAESLRSYRQRMRLSRPGHVWDTLEDGEFLIKLGAAGFGEDGKRHPTSAGLLMFGNEYDIVREYPNFFLDYREEYDDVHRWTDRFISSSVKKSQQVPIYKISFLVWRLFPTWKSRYFSHIFPNFF